MVRGSWYRLGAVLVAFGFLTIAIVMEGSTTMTLSYMQPSPFPPPVILLPPPPHHPLTPLDVCSVESAGRLGLGKRGEKDKESATSRTVYVFLWTTSVSSRETWTHMLELLPHVRLAYLDIRQAVRGTPLEFSYWKNSLPFPSPWAMWAAVGHTLMWKGGGALLSLGTLVNEPFLNALKHQEGLLVGSSDHGGGVNPFVMALPRNHPISSSLIHALGNDTYSYFRSSYDVTPWELQTVLLQAALEEECGVNQPQDLPSSDCPRLQFLPSEKVKLLDFIMYPIDERPSTAPKATPALFHPTSSVLDWLSKDPSLTLHLLKSNGVDHLCPFTVSQLRHHQEKQVHH
ncbi:uncharacterized protein LOC143035493 isoform X2 [Oratosquilla oratoria]